jgi:hypothetical protein
MFMRSRFPFLLLLVALSLVCSACSYGTDFVIVNRSVQPIVVRYRIRQFPGDFSPRDKPATIAASNLDSHGGQEWKLLNSDQFQVDPELRTVTVRVSAGEALRITTLHNYRGHDKTWAAGEFPVDEILISGANGELKLTGQQARITFAEVSRALYTLTYK